MVAVLEATQPSFSRLDVTEPDEDGMPVNSHTQQALSVTVVYANRSILYSNAKWQCARRSALAGTLKQFRSSGSSPMMEAAVIKRQRTTNEMMSAAG